MSKWLNSLTFNNIQYPKEVMSEERPPPCVFVPENDILEKMIIMTSKYTFEKRKLLLSKFSDQDFNIV